MNCSKCGKKMIEEFENIKGKVTIIFYCENCENIEKEEKNDNRES